MGQTWTQFQTSTELALSLSAPRGLGNLKGTHEKQAGSPGCLEMTKSCQCSARL